MPLTIRLESENGSIVGEVTDFVNTITRLSESLGQGVLEIAHTIDPYGDTSMNALQIPLFLRDIERLRQVCAQEEHILQLVEDLARKSQSDHHVYLKFYGD